jgi:hypothetical protein
LFTFINEAAIVFNAPLHSTIASCAANASNLFLAVINGKLVNFEISCATATSKPSYVFKPYKQFIKIMKKSQLVYKKYKI